MENDGRVPADLERFFPFFLDIEPEDEEDNEIVIRKGVNSDLHVLVQGGANVIDATADEGVVTSLKSIRS